MKLASLVALCLAAAPVAPSPTRKDAVSRQNKAKASVQTSQAFLALADRFVKDSLPLSQGYAPKETRLAHVLARIGQIPRFLDQARQVLADSDPIFVKVAAEENDGNVELIEKTVAGEIPAGSLLRAQYDKVAPPAVAALKG